MAIIKLTKAIKHKVTIVLSKSIFLLLMTLSCFSIQAGWEVHWIDKFNGSNVNWNNWTAQVQANYNNEVQCYTNDDSTANKNYDVSDGTLKIIARKQSLNCPGLNGIPKTWTSGRLNSKDKQEFLYGRIESRIRFHDLEGGTWPAFWMLENRIAEAPKKNDNDFINWPQMGAGEIDVWEWFSNEPNTYITNFFNVNGCGSEVRYNYPNGSADVLTWHKYAIEWNENTIQFFIDETLVTSHNVSGCSQYKEAMFVLLNVAMGGNLGGTIDNSLTTATMEVDYVAHCMPSTTNTSTYCDENTPLATNLNDDDQDGIINSLDLCPETPLTANVDENGCEITLINQAPVAVINSSATQYSAGELIQLSADSSYDDDNDVLEYTWQQTAGPDITLTNTNGADLEFSAPELTINTTLTFSVNVFDGELSDLTSINITILAEDDTTTSEPETPNNTNTNPESTNSNSGGSFSWILLSLLITYAYIVIVEKQDK